MNNFLYYAVIGTNGVAVMSSYKGVLQMRTYLRKCTCKGFNNFQDACDWVSYMLADRFPQADLGPIHFQLNRAVFVRQLIQKSENFYD